MYFVSTTITVPNLFATFSSIISPVITAVYSGIFGGIGSIFGIGNMF